MKFTTSALLFAALVSSTRAITIDVLETDINGLVQQVTDLDKAVTNFKVELNPVNTLNAGIAIANAGNKLNDGINATTTDAKNLSPCPTSESDGQVIFDAISNLEPIIMHGLSTLEAKLSIVKGVGTPLTTMASSGLQRLNVTVAALADALILCTPVTGNLTAASLDLKARIMAKIGEVVQAVSN